MNEIVTIINTLGFPIAVCIALFWFNQKMLESQQMLLKEFQNTLRDNTEMMMDNNEIMKTLIRELHTTNRVVKNHEL